MLCMHMQHASPDSSGQVPKLTQVVLAAALTGGGPQGGLPAAHPEGLPDRCIKPFYAPLVMARVHC